MHLPEAPELWKWTQCSKTHRPKFVRLCEYGKEHPEDVKEINGVRFCCTQEFLIGKGDDGSRTYVGLGKDGYERAVKRLHKDSCISLADQEKLILNQANAKQSNHVINYWFFDDESDKEYLYLILDLCEEDLEEFTRRTNLENLREKAPNILKQILKGLSHLHSSPQPILHRGIKPSNILRDVDDNWLLAEFGLSRLLARGASTLVSKQRGTHDWRAVESYPTNSDNSDEENVRYKRESDIQVRIYL